MFPPFRCIIAPEWIHSCQSSGDRKAVATFDHLTLAAHPSSLNRATVSSERVAPSGRSRLRFRINSLPTVGIYTECSRLIRRPLACSL